MRVYVAGPLTHGDRMKNIRAAIEVGESLRSYGHHPFVPHLNDLWQLVYPQTWKEWMRIDLAWVEVSQALVRIPGYSRGADEEWSHAIKHGVPVFDSVAEFLDWEEKRNVER